MPSKISKDSFELWKYIEKNLTENIDLEPALQKNSINEDIEYKIIKITYDLILNMDMQLFIEILTGCRTLPFSDYLSQFNISLYNLVVITTNYDLLTEYACEHFNHPYINY